MDADKIATRNSRMWTAIADRLRLRAIDEAETGDGSKAVLLGRMAEACLWQSYGDSDINTIATTTIDGRA